MLDRQGPRGGTEPFRGLVLRHRGRTGLTQRQLASRMGVHMRSIQDWEAGVNHPSAERLRALIAAFLDAGGLTAGREAAEAEALWVAALREAPRMQTPFDSVWLDELLIRQDERARPDQVPAGAVPAADGPTERRQDWGEAPDVVGFLGRTRELETVQQWLLQDRCRLVAILGMGGIGKTVLAVKLCQEVAPKYERVYWRSMRNAPPLGEWFSGAIGFLSDQQLVPPEGEAARLATLLQLLRERRCLLVLDNMETLLEPGQSEGRYRDGYAGYGRML